MILIYWDIVKSIYLFILEVIDIHKTIIVFSFLFFFLSDGSILIKRELARTFIQQWTTIAAWIKVETTRL